MQYQFRILDKHYRQLRDHLFPGDKLEAVALILCGRHEKNDLSILLSHEVILIPHNECERNENYVKWKTTRAINLFERIEKHNFAIVKIHCHPTGYPEFSHIDDESDKDFFSSAFSWSETDSIHASLIMLPEGRIFGRVFEKNLMHRPISRIQIISDVIDFYKIEDSSKSSNEKNEFAKRMIQAFGEGTYQILKSLRVGVVGCSGTGSPTIEQLARLGVGTIVIVDSDTIEEKNLNRILNSAKKNIGELKVSTLKDAIENLGLGTQIHAYPSNMFNSIEAIDALIKCDVIFGCVDRVDARNLLSRLTNFYLIPYFDLGVRLIANGNGIIKTVVGSVHYLQPGKSSLFSRKVYSQEKLESECIQRTNPDKYTELVQQKYIQGIEVERPAVISINMLVSSIAISEFLNRIHPYKDDNPNNYACIMVDYCGSCMDNYSEDSFDVDQELSKWAGRGICQPFLRMPELDF